MPVPVHVPVSPHHSSSSPSFCASLVSAACARSSFEVVCVSKTAAAGLATGTGGEGEAAAVEASTGVDAGTSRLLDMEEG